LTKNNIKPNLFKQAYHFIILLISMAGYVPQNADFFRDILMVVSLAFVVMLNVFLPHNPEFGIFYFLISEVLYIGFITVVLSKDGLRHWFVKKWGEDKGYLNFETLVGFLFFNNAASIGYIASANPGNLFGFVDKYLIFIITAILFIGGFTVKVLAAKVVTIDIYYWKDMFLGRKITDFVVTGPYKYFSNPMYGIGQLPAYAVAIWYQSPDGLVVAALNQMLVFTFYFLVEKKFINRVYQDVSTKPDIIKSTFRQ